jgi:TnpA family transposase
MDDRLLARRHRLRRRCQAGLNKGGARHFLALAVYVHRQGRFTEGVDTQDLKEAKALIDALAS